MIEFWTADRLLTPVETLSPGAMAVEDGRIVAVGAREAMVAPQGARLRDFGASMLAPGLVDIHVHGGVGFDFMSAGPAEVAAIRRHLARHGVTEFVATTVTARWAAILAAVERLARAGLAVRCGASTRRRAKTAISPTCRVS